jgi:hypothetical protein
VLASPEWQAHGLRHVRIAPAGRPIARMPADSATKPTTPVVIETIALTRE